MEYANRQQKVKVALLRALAQIERLRRRLRRDPNAFMEFAFRDETGKRFKQAWFHREWQDIWTQQQSSLIMAARGHGKSSQLIGRVVWELGNNPNLRIKLVCQSDTKAKERLYEIVANIMLNPRVRFVFPHLKPAAKAEWSKHKIYVQREAISRDASIEAVGVLSTATGGRSDLNIYDDIVDRRNAIQYPKLRETVRHAVNNDWTNLLDPRGRTWAIGTPWHQADYWHDLMKEGSGYFVKKYSIPADFTPIWPEVWSRESLKTRRKKIGPVAYDRGYRLIALSGDVLIIQPDWIRYERLDQMPDDLVFVCAYDLAISKRKRADYFGWCVIGWSRTKKRLYVVDAGHKHGASVQWQSQRLIADWAKWQAARVVVETVGYQEALAQVVGAEAVLPLYGFRPGDSKELRLQAVSPYVETGKVIFAKTLDPSMGHVSTETGDVIAELTEFPLYATDDVMDAFVEGALCVLDMHAEELREGKAGAGGVGVPDYEPEINCEIYAIG